MLRVNWKGTRLAVRIVITVILATGCLLLAALSTVLLLKKFILSSLSVLLCVSCAKMLSPLIMRRTTNKLTLEIQRRKFSSYHQTRIRCQKATAPPPEPIPCKPAPPTAAPPLVFPRLPRKATSNVEFPHLAINASGALSSSIEPCSSCGA